MILTTLAESSSENYQSGLLPGIVGAVIGAIVTGIANAITNKRNSLAVLRNNLLLDSYARFSDSKPDIRKIARTAALSLKDSDGSIVKAEIVDGIKSSINLICIQVRELSQSHITFDITSKTRRVEENLRLVENYIEVKQSVDDLVISIRRGGSDIRFNDQKVNLVRELKNSLLILAEGTSSLKFITQKGDGEDIESESYHVAANICDNFANSERLADYSNQLKELKKKYKNTLLFTEEYKEYEVERDRILSVDKFKEEDALDTLISEFHFGLDGGHIEILMTGSIDIPFSEISAEYISHLDGKILNNNTGRGEGFFVRSR